MKFGTKLQKISRHMCTKLQIEILICKEITAKRVFFCVTWGHDRPIVSVKYAITLLIRTQSS